MKCRKAQRLISEYIDGELDLSLAAGLEKHLDSCPSCRGILEDLRRVVVAAPELASPSPSGAVWSAIRTRLAAGGAETARRPLFGWSMPGLRWAGAAALALVFIAAGIIFGIRTGRDGVPSGLGDREKFTLAKLDEAERYYQQAIRSLGEAFAAQKGTLVPQVVEMFERNLSVVDATIQACRQAVLAEPDDLKARSYLLAAYLDKVNLLDAALSFERRNPAVADKDRIL